MERPVSEKIKTIIKFENQLSTDINLSISHGTEKYTNVVATTIKAL